MHQKIRPHTKKPTASAATTEPIHRSYMRSDCVVMPRGQPKPRKVSSNEHPASSVTRPTAETASPTTRVPRETLGTTLARVLDHAAPAWFGVGVSRLGR